MRTGSSMVWTPIQGSVRSGSSSNSGSRSGASTSSVKSRAGTPVLGRDAISRSSLEHTRTPLPTVALLIDQQTRDQDQPPPEQQQQLPQPTTATTTRPPSPTSSQQQQPQSAPLPPSLPSTSGLSQNAGLTRSPEQTTSPAIHGEQYIADEGKSTDTMEVAEKPAEEDGSEEDFTSQQHSVIVEFLQAAWYAVLSHTDFICYFLVFLNQIKSASLLSLPLPLMVTLWGTLTFPRPSKNFWVTLIAYTQTVVILKCVCQFEMLWWNQNPIPPNQPFSPARIIGIEQKKGYATYDLALLLVLFCHRFILKSLGLWKSDFVEEPEPSEGLYKLDTHDEKNESVDHRGRRN